MEKELEKAVSSLTEKATRTKNAIDAMQYTQAALNAANALMTLKQRSRIKS